MHLKVAQIRETITGKTKSAIDPKMRPDLLSFLDESGKCRAEILANRILPGENEDVRKARQDIFEYIVNFWERSVLEVPYLADAGKGSNLAKRPYCAPTGKGDDSFWFVEQYRWDTYFQNQGLLLAGGVELATNQLLNLSDTFKTFKRIPNALTTSFLSHAQPPFEMQALFEILAKTGEKQDWMQEVVEMCEEELVTEWWDLESGSRQGRQNKDLVEDYDLLTRHSTGFHFHPLLSGCEDGKDHNWLTITYGGQYFPVQLNSLIYNTLMRLVDWYGDEKLGNSPEKAALYKGLAERLQGTMTAHMWRTREWTGFHNVSTRGEDAGVILHPELAAEVWPLYGQVATPEQAQIIRDNIVNYYEGSFGLTTTSQKLKNEKTLAKPPGPWSFQWEYPNCWPPLMVAAARGLQNYGFEEDATRLMQKWVEFMEHEFRQIGGFAEKSPYDKGVQMDEGYYGILKGFGWTISTYLTFVRELHNKQLLK